VLPKNRFTVNLQGFEQQFTGFEQHAEPKVKHSYINNIFIYY